MPPLAWEREGGDGETEGGGDGDGRGRAGGGGPIEAATTPRKRSTT